MTAAAVTATSDHRALVTTVAAASPDIERSPRPMAPYLTQLLATKYGLPQTRLRRCADAHDAAAVYEDASMITTRLRHHRLSREL
jgi:hypothetical protein